MTRNFLTTVLVLISGLSCGTTAGIAQNEAMKSVTEDSRPVKVAFSNETAGNLTALWMDEKGIAQEIGTIFPHQVVELTTFPGHVTVFSSGGHQISSFRATVYSNGASFGIAGTAASVDLQTPQVIGCTFLPPEIAVCTFPPPGQPANLPPNVIVCTAPPATPKGVVPTGVRVLLTPPPATPGTPGTTTVTPPPSIPAKPVAPQAPVAQGNPPVTVQDVGAVIRFIIQNL